MEKIERDDAEKWLNENRDIWNHPIISDRNEKESYEVADLMADFANYLALQKENDPDNQILQAHQQYVGKKFVYCTKYGGYTHGVIDQITASYECIFDPETTEKLQAVLAKDNIARFKQKQEFKKTGNYKWAAIREKIKIISTNKIIYDFNEIYILK